MPSKEKEPTAAVLIRICMLKLATMMVYIGYYCWYQVSARWCWCSTVNAGINLASGSAGGINPVAPSSTDTKALIGWHWGHVEFRVYAPKDDVASPMPAKHHTRKIAGIQKISLVKLNGRGKTHFQNTILTHTQNTSCPIYVILSELSIWTN